jgi:replication factor A1
MKISELQIRQGNVDVEGTIKEIGEPRSFDRFGKQIRVADAILEDDSGTIKLTLWNDDIDQFKVGDNVKIVNGYVNEFQGEKQLTSGKFGKLEKVGEGEAGESTEEQTEAPAESAEPEAPIEEKIEAPAEEAA